MSRTLALLFVVSSIGCQSARANEEPAPRRAPEQPIAFTAARPTVAAPVDLGFVVHEVPPGELRAALRAESLAAGQRGLKPFAYVYAKWCKPCDAFARSLADVRMQQALRGTYLVKIDYDQVTDADWRALGTHLKVVPSFFKIDPAGKVSGKPLGGDSWKENTPSNMAPPLGRFFAS